MKYYIISDTHFGHSFLVEKQLRPPNYEEKIIKNLKNINFSDSMLLHLGDFMVCQSSEERKWCEIWKSLNIPTVFIRGNHDRKSDSWYYNNCGFNFVSNGIELKLYGKNIKLSHYPIKTSEEELNVHGHMHEVPGSIYSKIFNKNNGPEFANHYDEFTESGKLMLNSSNHFLYSAEYFNYFPVKLNDIIEKFFGKKNKILEEKTFFSCNLS